MFIGHEVISDDLFFLLKLAVIQIFWHMWPCIKGNVY